MVQLDIEEKIKNFLRKNILRSGEGTSLSEEENILESGLLDSMDIVQLIAFLAKEFGVSVGEKDFKAENFTNIKRIAEFVREKKK